MIVIGLRKKKSCIDRAAKFRKKFPDAFFSFQDCGRKCVAYRLKGMIMLRQCKAMFWNVSRFVKCTSNCLIFLCHKPSAWTNTQSLWVPESRKLRRPKKLTTRTWEKRGRQRKKSTGNKTFEPETRVRISNVNTRKRGLSKKFWCAPKKFSEIC